MSRTMRNLIIFMDATGDSTVTPLKYGNSFMNRFSIDEDAAFEIIGIHHLESEHYEQSVKEPGGMNMTSVGTPKIGNEMKNVFQNISVGFPLYFIFEISKRQKNNFEWNKISC